MAAAAVLLVAVGMMFGPQVVRIAMNKGQIVIKTDDPNIEVTVKEGGATLLDRTSGRTITVAAGEHQLEVTVKLPGEDAIQFRTDQFTLTRGGNKIVDVGLELAKVDRSTGGPLVGSKDSQPSDTASARLRPSPLDQLDPAKIPAEELFDWQPKELVAVLGEHRQRHWGEVTSVAFNPNGKQIASGGRDGFVRVWDALGTAQK